MASISLDSRWSCSPIPTVFPRWAAIQRLSHLIPGSQEHSQLQEALIKTHGIMEITLPHLSYKIDSSPCEERLLGGFGSSEHVAIGAAVCLQGFSDQPPLLQLGATDLYFQHIVALAGDFYGVAGQPISLLGGTDEEKTDRFKAAFKTLAEADPHQLRKIFVEVERECAAVHNSSLPHHCYSHQMIEKHHALEKIKPDVTDLLADNSDHFSKHAEDAYRIGHTLALEEARKAGPSQDLEGLKYAYALDAFACHFLTDLFAAGHIRNQRGDLEHFLCTQLGFTGSKVKKLAGILTGAQHEKDGHEGLNVSNGSGESWRTYGDGNFFSPKNLENKKKVIDATQSSVDEVYLAYSDPGTIQPSGMQRLIPHATQFNPPPLYEIKETSLFLYQGSERIEIKTQAGYLTKGLSHALRYLPQKYIDGFITPDVQIDPLVSKVIAPQVERLTGAIWGILGMASARQLRQGQDQLNEKIDEMAETVQTTYENTSAILEEIKKCRAEVAEVRRTQIFQELTEAIGEIKTALFEHRHYKGSLTPGQRKDAMHRLWKAKISMARILAEGTAEGVQVLIAYGMMLKATSNMGEEEIKLNQTMWLQSMIHCQSLAFGVYGSLYLEEGNGENQEEVRSTLEDQIGSFQATITAQINANQEWIDVTLIDQSPSYLALQKEKMEMKRLWIAPN